MHKAVYLGPLLASSGLFRHRYFFLSDLASLACRANAKAKLCFLGGCCWGSSVGSIEAIGVAGSLDRSNRGTITGTLGSFPSVMVIAVGLGGVSISCRALRGDWADASCRVDCHCAGMIFDRASIDVATVTVGPGERTDGSCETRGVARAVPMALLRLNSSNSCLCSSMSSLKPRNHQ